MSESTAELNYESAPDAATGQKVIRLAISAGHGLLANGGETYRVEETMRHIVEAYAGSDGEAFALPSYLSLTLYDKDGIAHTVSNRVRNRKIDLEIVNRINAVSRQITSSKPPLDEACAMINRAIEERKLADYLRLFAGVLIGFSFTLLFGADLYGGLIAALASLLGVAINLFLERHGTNAIFSTTIAAMVMTLTVIVCIKLGYTGSSESIISGALMNLVPGIAFTVGIRDLVESDYLSGLARLAEAVLVAVAIAVGSGSAFYIASIFS